MEQRLVVSDVELLSVAKITSIVGIKGSVKVSPYVLNSKELSDLLGFVDAVFLYSQGDFPKRIKIKLSEVKKNTVIIAFLDLNNIDSVQNLVGKQLFVSSACYTKFLYKTENPLRLLGYNVVDFNYGDLGIITGLSRNGQLLIIMEDNNKKELIAPLVKEFIISINHENKKIELNLPEGLFD